MERLPLAPEEFEAEEQAALEALTAEKSQQRQDVALQVGSCTQPPS